jgi:hypothetical protein
MAHVSILHPRTMGTTAVIWAGRIAALVGVLGTAADVLVAIRGPVTSAKSPNSPQAPSCAWAIRT